MQQLSTRSPEYTHKRSNTGRMLATLFALSLFLLAGCSGDQDNPAQSGTGKSALPTDTPINFSGGSATLVKCLEHALDSPEGMVARDRSIGVELAWTPPPGSTPDNASALTSICSLIDQEGNAYQHSAVLSKMEGNKKFIVLLFTVPKDLPLSELSLRAGEQTIQLPKPEQGR